MEQATTEPPLKPPKRKLKWWHVVLIVIPGALVIGVITKAVLAPPNNGAGASSSNKFTVSVTGSTRNHADIDVNYNGRWTQLNNQRLPWSHALGIGIVSVAAENGGRNGSITCTITNSDGSVRDTQTSTGPYAEVACNTNPAISGTSSSAGNSGAAGSS
jgi:hypothetical protein